MRKSKEVPKFTMVICYPVLSVHFDTSRAQLSDRLLPCLTSLAFYEARKMHALLSPLSRIYTTSSCICIPSILTPVTRINRDK